MSAETRALDRSGHGSSEGEFVGLELVPGEEADAIAEAARGGPDGSEPPRVHRDPAVLVVSGRHRLHVPTEEVAACLGRPWDTDELQPIMATYWGYIGRWDKEGVVLEWMGEPTG